MTGAARTGGPIGKMVTEVLGSVVSPDLRDQALDKALASSGSASIPEEPRAAKEFIEGPLAEALKSMVGLEVSAVVIDSLQPILSIASLPPSAPPGSLPDEPPPPLDPLEGLPAVLGPPSAVVVPASFAPAAEPTPVEIDVEADIGADAQADLSPAPFPLERTTSPPPALDHDVPTTELLAPSPASPANEYPTGPPPAPEPSAPAPAALPPAPAPPAPEPPAVAPPFPSPPLPEPKSAPHPVPALGSGSHPLPVDPDAMFGDLASHLEPDTTPHAEPVSGAFAPRAGIILVASVDSAKLAVAHDVSGGRIPVQRVTDTFELMTELGNHADERPLLIIDCIEQTVDVVTLATMLPAMPAGAQVLLWGAEPALHEQVKSTSPVAAGWIAVPPTESHENISMLIGALVAG